MKEYPKISIITASYNQGEFIEETICSILDQNYPNLEYIIIDGGSNDNSVEIIKRYEKHLTWWVSEPDKGQSDAFNKGFRRATGDLMTWINSDDVLLPGSLEAVAIEKKKYPDCQWFSAKMVKIDINSKVVNLNCSEKPNHALFNMGVCPVYVPSTFFSRGLLAKSGGFDLNLNYTMDFDLWMKFNKLGHIPILIDSFVYGFRAHMGSKTMASEASENLDYNHENDPKWEKIGREKEYIMKTYNYGPANKYHKLGMALSRLLRLPSYIKAKTLTKKYKDCNWSDIA